MTGSMRQRVVRSLPGIGWRDVKLAERAEQVAALRAQIGDLQAQIADLRAERATARAELDRCRKDALAPSYQFQIWQVRRMAATLRQADPRRHHPSRQVALKLRNYQLVASHGFAVPEVYGAWTGYQDIVLHDLPDTFVVKSDLGAGARGVLPLRRVGADAYEVVDGSRVLSTHEVREHFERSTTSFGPYFAEELLQDEGGRPIPDDVKFYAFYGKVGHFRVRRSEQHGDTTLDTHHYFDADGGSLAKVNLLREHTAELARPSRWEEMSELVRHITRAVPVPFLRVDLYQTTRGPVFGEFTRAGGGQHRYRREHGALLGTMWEQAQTRIEMDVALGRPYQVLHGTSPSPNPYPADHISRQADPGTWAVTSAPCEQWCRD